MHGDDGAQHESMYHEGYDEGRGDGLSFHSSAPSGIDEAEVNQEVNSFEARARDRDGNLIVTRGRGSSATKRPSIEPFHGPITMGMPGEGEAAMGREAGGGAR